MARQADTQSLDSIYEGLDGDNVDQLIVRKSCAIFESKVMAGSLNLGTFVDVPDCYLRADIKVTTAQKSTVPFAY
ncbi:hypothetical protein F1880_005163 [Penicillium rolfsii]|nr:hypothetical protein F1880_005163 [Penicillium rolfsii]